jgi:hypothetical protein
VPRLIHHPKRSDFFGNRLEMAAGAGANGCRRGAVCRPRCRDMPLCAAICWPLERKLLIFLGLIVSCQRGGRRFEPGLVLQEMERPDRSCDRAFLVRVMVGGLLGPLPPPAHPQQRHQAAPPRGQQQPARGLAEQHDVGSPIEDTERSVTARPLRG